MSVVCFHLVAAARTYNNPVFTQNFFLRLGASGVDIFFVISGFVMVYVQVRRRRTSAEFFIDRILRIAPIYWLLLFVMAIALLGLPDAFGTQTFTLSRVAGSFSFTSSTLFSQPPLIFIGWTIELEMMFYLLFSFSLVAQKITTSVVSVIVGILVLVLVFNLPIILIEFIFGMLIGLFVYDKRVSQKVYILSLIVGVSGFASSALFDLESVDRVIKWGIPSFFLVFGAIGVKQLKNSLLIEIGNASYSIYLIQVFTIPVIYKVVGHLDLPQLSEVWALLCLTVTTGIGWVFYRVIEWPIANQIRRWRTAA